MRGVHSSLFHLWKLLLLVLAVGIAMPAPAASQDRILRVAASLQAPYQFYHLAHETEYLTGIDVVTFRRAAAKANLAVVINGMPWGEALQGIASGEVDAILAALRSPERELLGIFSVPLRFSQESLFLPPELHPDAASAKELLAKAARRGLRIGVVRDFELGGEVKDFREQYPDSVLEVSGLDQLIPALLAGQIDGFILDRYAGYALLDRYRIWDLEPHALPVYEATLGALFSKASVESELVERFNRALTELQVEGETKSIKRRFILSVMMDIALYGQWFEAILILGMVAFSISAVVIARNGGYSLYGALVLASLPAMGGGVVRDLLILREPYIFDSPIYVQILLATLVAGYFINRLFDLLHGRSLLFFDLVNVTLLLKRRLRPQLLMQLLDAAGMAAFSIVAITVAVEFGRDPLWLWGPVMAVLTATGGAVLRDMIRPDGADDMLRNGSWGETVVLWCLPLSFYLQYFGHSGDPETIFWALMICMLGIFATRIAFVTFDWRAPRY